VFGQCSTCLEEETEFAEEEEWRPTFLSRLPGLYIIERISLLSKFPPD